jgi:hypothetical protein
VGRRRAFSVLAVLSILISACTGHTEVSTGVLTGNAQACSGIESVPTAHLDVHKGTVLIASKDVPDNTTYRFVLPAGHYDITNTGTAGFLPPLGRNDLTRKGNFPRPLAHSVSISPGGTAHVDVPDDCM